MAKILVVDDDASLVEIVAETLDTEDFDITTATDPTVALKHIEADIFDLVITDLNMPEVDGLTLARAARERSTDTDVIVITGYGSLDSAIQAMKDEVYDYILKPFNVSDIHRTVGRVLEKQRLSRANRELHERVQEYLAQIETLQVISRFINSSGDLDKVLLFTGETITSGIGVDSYTIMLKDPDTGQFSIARADGISSVTRERFTVQSNEGPLGRAFLADDVVFVDDVADDPGFQAHVDPADRDRMQPFGVIPLRIEDDVVGAITVHGLHADDERDREKIQLLSLVGTQLAPLIRLYQNLAEQEVLGTDPLFLVKKTMKRTLDKAAADQGELVFLVLKLYLKPTEGVQPRILQVHERVLQTLQAGISRIDSVIVMGLDTFVVILQSRSQVEAEVFVDRITKDIEGALREVNQSAFVVDHGMAVFPMDGTTAEDLIGRAQQNLWRAAKGTK